jgi:hypothetical protein
VGSEKKVIVERFVTSDISISISVKQTKQPAKAGCS